GKKVILHRINKIEYGRLFYIRGKKGAFFTLPAFDVICRRQHFLAGLPKIKKTSNQSSPV
ncbi:hypothetical protein, partial [Bacteroides acidifaciens]|uniref:hypothetical protein n=1 Tax=Bacteroides acidifaciens TaxID=85831 RepID=UPI0025583BDB